MSTVATYELLPEVRAFLDDGPFAAFVGGQDYPAASGKTVATIDPGSGDTLAEVHDLSAAEVDRAVDIANEAFPAWSALPADERFGLLRKLADAVEADKAIIGQIEALDAGKIQAQAQGDVQNLVDTLRRAS